MLSIKKTLTKRGNAVSEERFELSTNGLKGRPSAHVSHNQCPAIFAESIGRVGKKYIGIN